MNPAQDSFPGYLDAESHCGPFLTRPMSVAVPVGMGMIVFVVAAMIGSMIMPSMTVPMVAGAGGMAWRCHRHYHQNERGHDIQAGDVKKSGFDTTEVEQ